MHACIYFVQIYKWRNTQSDRLFQFVLLGQEHNAPFVTSATTKGIFHFLRPTRYTAATGKLSKSNSSYIFAMAWDWIKMLLAQISHPSKLYSCSSPAELFLAANIRAFKYLNTLIFYNFLTFPTHFRAKNVKYRVESRGSLRRICTNLKRSESQARSCINSFIRFVHFSWLPTSKERTTLLCLPHSPLQPWNLKTERLHAQKNNKNETPPLHLHTLLHDEIKILWAIMKFYSHLLSCGNNVVNDTSHTTPEFTLLRM